jgi:hypothetical protein
MSTDPTIRALQRIQALEERGVDPVQGTLQRLNATTNPDKLLGIMEAAQEMANTAKSQVRKQQWHGVVTAARSKYRKLAA